MDNGQVQEIVQNNQNREIGWNYLVQFQVQPSRLIQYQVSVEF